MATNSTGERAPAQGGIFEGLNPATFNPADPIVLFIVQAIIVIALSRLLYWPLSKIREPRVIAEVIAGILLGPSALGRIPGFSDAIFPKESMAPFRLAANIGLILYLFLVGMEINLVYLLRNWRTAVGVATLDMAIPFGCGFALAYGLYRQFGDDPELAPISFPIFALFIGVAIAITAFPVLCRILTALKLLNTNVGVVVLTSGIINDVIGWILLALCVTLVNSGAGVTAVFILLTSVGYALFLAFAIRPCFIRLLRKTHSLENGPTEAVVALTLLLVLASAFFTSIIGVHSIFGAFMVGLMCPHEGGFAIKLTEKIEDLISTLFVPLFFALSGINTNLSLLDSGIVWGYVIAVTSTAFFTKLFGGTIGARLSGLVWRESVTIGTLMSCKGLVELIVLNIGLQAKILSPRTFTIFVVMALITTFLTAPLTSWLYPPSYQRRLDLWRQGRISQDGAHLKQPDQSQKGDAATNILVYLRTDGLSSLLPTVSFFASARPQRPSGQPNHELQEARESHVKHPEFPFKMKNLAEPPNAPMRIHGCRLVGLSERNSSVMKVCEIETCARQDPIIKAFSMSATKACRDMVISGQISVVPESSFAETLASTAARLKSDLVLVPWSETGTVSELPSLYGVFSDDPLVKGDFPQLMSSIFAHSRSFCSVAVIIDSSLLALNTHDTSSISGFKDNSDLSLLNAASPSVVKIHSAEAHHTKCLRVLFTGHDDDLLAVRLAIQLSHSEDLQLEIVSLPEKDEAETQRWSRLKSHISKPMVNRIKWTDLSGGKGSIASQMLEKQSSHTHSTIYILGRSVASDMDGGSGLCSVLGPVGGSLAEEIRRTGNVNSSMIVVQAKIGEGRSCI